jgi:hypothetical protein
MFFANLHEADDEKTVWRGASKVLTRGTDEKRLKAEQWGKK